MSTSKNVKTVAIIGAGVSGLCVAKYLLAERLAENPNAEMFKVVIFEQNLQAGGVWNQNQPEDQFATPMYLACTSIVPTDMMQYSDFPYKEETALFPKNTSIARYLHAYARDLEDRGIIEYNTEVVNVCRQLAPGSNQLKWEVKIRKGGRSNDKEDRSFDFLILALGTFTKEYVPKRLTPPTTSNIEILHSKKYRTADRFAGKKVLIVGDGPASLEMSKAILKVCKGTLLVSVKDRETSRFNTSTENMEVLLKVEKICHSTKNIYFEDGRQEKVDIILLCTGYTYDFKMLDCIKMTKDEKRVLGLYEHMILIDETIEPSVAPEDVLQSRTIDTDRAPYEICHNKGHPSLAIIGLPTMNSVFLVAEAQSAFIARYFSGRLHISISQMKSEQDEKEQRFNLEVRNRKRTNAQFHAFSYPSDANYVDELFRKCLAAEDRGTGKLPQFHTLKLHWLRDNMDAIRTADKASAGETRSEELLTAGSSWWLPWIRDCIPMDFGGARSTTLESLGFEFDESTASSSEVREGARIMKVLQNLMKRKRVWSWNWTWWLIKDVCKKEWDRECSAFHAWRAQQEERAS